MVKDYDTARHLHFDVAVFHMNKTSRRVEMTVVVGRATVEASNEAHQVILRAVQLSVKLQR